MIRSRSFQRQFPAVTESDLYAGMLSYCENRAGGALGSDVLRLFDSDGIPHPFRFETFFNRYEALTLGFYLRVAAKQVVI